MPPTLSVTATMSGARQLRSTWVSDEAQLGDPERPRGLDVLGLLHREHGGAHDAPVERNVDDGHRHHAVDEAGPEGRDDRDREEEVGEGHQGVDRAHDELIHPAAHEAGQQPADRARRGGERGGGETHHQRGARAVEQPAQEVAAELVGAEQVPGE